MFFPSMRPRDIVGQSLLIRGTYLGCAVIQLETGPIAGLLFRDGADIYVCHVQAGADESALVVTNVGDRAASAINDFRETVGSLKERIETDRQALVMKDAAIKLLQTANQELSELANRHATELERLGHVLDQRQRALDRYNDVVGPLDPPPPPADAPKLDFGAEPPPVVESDGGDHYPNGGRGEVGNTIPREWSDRFPVPVDSDLL